MTTISPIRHLSRVGTPMSPELWAWEQTSDYRVVAEDTLTDGTRVETWWFGATEDTESVPYETAVIGPGAPDNRHVEKHHWPTEYQAVRGHVELVDRLEPHVRVWPA
jgi:hypothetical protein